MAGGIDWFRWHHGSVTDPKFQLVARKSGTNLPAVLAVWAYVLETASQATDRGTFEIDAESLDCHFGLEDGATARILAAMEERRLLGDGKVCSWEKRQPKREDDTAAERKRRQRARDQQAPEKSAEPVVTDSTSRDVTQSHADVTPMSRDVTTEESREEKRYSEPNGSAAVAASTPTDREMVFALGIPMLTAAAVPEARARSMLASLCKKHGDAAVHDGICATAKNGAGEPVSYLQRVLGAGGPRPNAQDALEQSNREVARRWAEGSSHAGA